MSTNSNPIGKVFLGISWAILLVGLTIFFQDRLERRENPNAKPISMQSGSVTEVVLRRNHQHHYVANGLINEVPVTFLVDTGATRVSLSRELAERIGLPFGLQGFANTANGLTTTYDTTLDSLKLGAIEFQRVQASITEGMQGDKVLLGMSALKQVELIHRNGELTIRQLN